MKVVVFSDLHMHNWSYGSNSDSVNPSIYNSRLQDGAKVLHIIHDYCFHHKIKYVFFTGDFFHTHGKLDASTLQLACIALRAFKKDGIHIFFIAGNHDMADKGGYVTSLEPFVEYGTVVKTRSFFKLDNVQIGMLAYTEDENVLNSFLHDYVGYIDTLDAKDNVQFLFMHQGVAGAPVGSGFVINEILEPDMIPKSITHAFTGHYHSHRKISDRLTIVGSPLQHTWADKNEKKGFLELDLCTGDYKFIPIKLSEFMELDFDFISFSMEVAEEELRSAIYENYIKVVGDIPYEKIRSVKEKLLDMGCRSVEFQIKPSEEIATKIATEDFDLNKLFDNYVKQNKIEDQLVQVGKLARSSSYDSVLTSPR